MPTKKSAARRVRNSARKHARNRSVKQSLKTIEKKYEVLLGGGKKEEAASAYRAVSSAFDKAAKGGVIARATASRKKSRLAARLNTLK